jgi:nucleotide-binding universal stress UspA family protein
MFKHVLIPTDGSAASALATRNGIAFARETGARVTLLHVCAPFHPLAWDVEALTDTREEYERHQERRARQILAGPEAYARSEGVDCTGSFVTHAHPHEAIIDAARMRGCDLILMASHGRKGISGLLLGSETQKVLAHSAIPVLVYR